MGVTLRRLILISCGNLARTQQQPFLFCKSVEWGPGHNTSQGVQNIYCWGLVWSVFCCWLAELSFLLLVRRHGKNKQLGRRVFINEVSALQGQKRGIKSEAVCYMADFWYLTDNLSGTGKRAQSWHCNKEHNKDIESKENGDGLGEVRFLTFPHLVQLCLQTAGVLKSCLKVCIHKKGQQFTWSNSEEFFFSVEMQMRIWYVSWSQVWITSSTWNSSQRIFLKNVIKWLGKLSVTGKCSHVFLSAPHWSWMVLPINIWDHVIIKTVLLWVGPSLNLHFCCSVLCPITLH